MGLLALGLGFGGPLALARGESSTSACTRSPRRRSFLSAGELVQQYGSRRLSRIRGTLARAPVAGGAVGGGIILLGGLPPSGIFVTEFAIVVGGVLQGYALAAALAAGLLAVAFVAARLPRDPPPLGAGRTRRRGRRRGPGDGGCDSRSHSSRWPCSGCGRPARWQPPSTRSAPCSVRRGVRWLSGRSADGRRLSGRPRAGRRLSGRRRRRRPSALPSPATSRSRARTTSFSFPCRATSSCPTVRALAELGARHVMLARPRPSGTRPGRRHWPSRRSSTSRADPLVRAAGRPRQRTGRPTRRSRRSCRLRSGTSARYGTSSGSCRPATRICGRSSSTSRQCGPAHPLLKVPPAVPPPARRPVPAVRRPGRGGLPAAGRPDPRRDHRAGPLPLLGSRRVGPPPRRPALLHAPRPRASSSRAARSTARCSCVERACGVCTVTHADCVQPGRRAADRHRHPAPGAAGPDPAGRARAALQPRRRSRQHLRRRRVPFRDLAVSAGRRSGCCA